MARSLPIRPILLACAALGAGPFGVPPAGAAAPPVAFERVAAALRGDDVSALALDPAGGRLAVGDPGGVLLGRPGEPLRRVLRRAPVHDLAFLPPGASGEPAGALLAATARGLYRIAADGAAVPLVLGPGEAAQVARRLAVAPGAVAVATDDGVFASADAWRWHRVSASLPSGPSRAVALRTAADTIECWVVVDGALWRVRLARGAAPSRGGAQRVTLPLAARTGGPVDVRVALAGADVAVLYPDALAVRAAPGADWEALRPHLPPGARAERLVAALGRVWIATDAGLLEAASLRARWQRAAPPAGSAAVRALAGDATSLYAATASGLLGGRLESRPPRSEPHASEVGQLAGRAARALPATAEEPSVGSVQRAALHYLGLEPARMETLRRRLSRRGWLPVLSLGLERDRSRSRSTQRDEAFVSGDYRLLEDRDRDLQHDLDFGVALSWDLGDLAYHPEQIDVSREAREVIELRDDVLDEITQLYYERRRVLVRLAEQPDPGSGEALRLRLRADELAAGIDAWTGGWFGRHAARLAP